MGQFPLEQVPAVFDFLNQVSLILNSLEFGQWLEGRGRVTVESPRQRGPQAGRGTQIIVAPHPGGQPHVTDEEEWNSAKQALVSNAGFLSLPGNPNVARLLPSLVRA
jgi:hypothetical protein